MCPMGVSTEMLDEDDPIHRFLHYTSISPEDVAEAVVTGLAEEQFLILPHPQIADLMQLKAQHHANWMKAAGRLLEKLDASRQ